MVDVEYSTIFGAPGFNRHEKRKNVYQFQCWYCKMSESLWMYLRYQAVEMVPGQHYP